MALAVHVFAFADSAHPNLCTLASSVAAAGGKLNVIGLNYGDTAGAVPPEALESIAEALAQQGQEQLVEGQRAAATLHCTTKEECLKSRGLAKVRKFFAVWPYLKQFKDDELLLIMDGYDVLLETPSLEHLQLAFAELQRRIGPVMSVPTGPVIFSGEANCWPFPHVWKSEPFASGDFRPGYVYNYGGRKKLRGDQVCEYWRQHIGHPGLVNGRYGNNRSEVLPLFLPFLNSGVFMGRAGSLRALFSLATEVLRLFGDFADQALATSVALHAKFLERPWVPLRVDHTGELFASLHGLSPELVARRLRAPPACNFQGKVDHGFFLAAQRKRSKWSSDRFKAFLRKDRPPPLVWHFNGDKKPYYEAKCHDSVAMETSVLGMPLGLCTILDVDHGKEHFFVAQGEERTESHARDVEWPRRAPVPPSATDMAGIMAESATAWQVAERLLKLGGSRVLVQRPGEPGGRSCLEQHWWLETTPAAGAPQSVFQRMTRAKEAQAPQAVMLDMETTRCQLGDEQAYCALLEELHTSWECLRSYDSNSTGLLLAFFEAEAFKASLHVRPRLAEECLRGRL
ncbi:unnamed protein product [Effrenium voratum]|uniref:Uncharacterized protein n=1 Tax=Effrenium voratum TaxID=2562239 RepID=A0AA36JGW7_9DINO|nr:unnamed protein product [Effrenium voratum]